jgi:hypothetical protein
MRYNSHRSVGNYALMRGDYQSRKIFFAGMIFPYLTLIISLHTGIIATRRSLLLDVT